MERQARQQGITELLQRVLPRAFLACLAVCLGSGILLLFQYRPFGDVFANVEEISSLAPFGFFFRRLHYFSGQGCTALALLHMLEHCLRGSYHRMSVPAWIRLGASLVFASDSCSPASFSRLTRRRYRPPPSWRA